MKTIKIVTSCVVVLSLLFLLFQSSCQKIIENNSEESSPEISHRSGDYVDVAVKINDSTYTAILSDSTLAAGLSAFFNDSMSSHELFAADTVNILYMPTSSYRYWLRGVGTMDTGDSLATFGLSLLIENDTLYLDGVVNNPWMGCTMALCCKRCMFWFNSKTCECEDEFLGLGCCPCTPPPACRLVDSGITKVAYTYFD